MAKIFELNFNKGSLIDQVTQTAMTQNNTPLPMKKTEKGLAYFNDGGTYYLSKTTTANVTTGTLVFAFKADKTLNAELNGCLGITNSTGVRFECYVGNGSSGQIRFFGGGNFWETPAGSVNMYDKRWHLMIATYDGVTKKVYVDNTEVTITGPTASITAAASTIFIGAVSTTVASSNDLKGNLGFKAQIYDHVLSTQERNQIYQDYLACMPISKPKRGFILNKPTDLSSKKYDTAGADILGGYDLINWFAQPATTINSATQFTTTSNSLAGIIKASLLTVGKRYRISITGTSTTSFTFGSASASGSEYGSGFTTVEFTALATGLWIRQQTAGTTTITNFTIQELTGLIAAYNFIN